MISSIVQALFSKIKTKSNISEQEKEQQRIYDLLNAETKQKKKKNSEIIRNYLRSLKKNRT